MSRSGLRQADDDDEVRLGRWALTMLRAHIHLINLLRQI